MNRLERLKDQKKQLEKEITELEKDFELKQVRKILGNDVEYYIKGDNQYRFEYTLYNDDNFTGDLTRELREIGLHVTFIYNERPLRILIGPINEKHSKEYEGNLTC